MWDRKSEIIKLSRRLYESGIDITQTASSLLSNYEHGIEASKKCEIAWVLDEVASFGFNAEKIRDMLDRALTKRKIGEKLWFEAKGLLNDLERAFHKNISENMSRSCSCRFVIPPWLRTKIAPSNTALDRAND